MALRLSPHPLFVPPSPRARVRCYAIPLPRHQLGHEPVRIWFRGRAVTPGRALRNAANIELLALFPEDRAVLADVREVAAVLRASAPRRAAFHALCCEAPVTVPFMLVTVWLAIGPPSARGFR